MQDLKYVIVAIQCPLLALSLHYTPLTGDADVHLTGAGTLCWSVCTSECSNIVPFAVASCRHNSTSTG